MGEMADFSMEGFWGLDDPDGWEQMEESSSFNCSCRYCGTPILMDWQEGKGWRPFKNGKIHICEARRKQQSKQLMSVLPDLTQSVECQFCQGAMMLEDFEGDPEETWPLGYTALVCQDCGATGPIIEQ